MNEITETISILEQKLSELIADYKASGIKRFANVSGDKIGFKTLAEELNESIFLLNNKGKIEYCNPATVKFFHSLNVTDNYDKLLSHFAESDSFFEFEENLKSFTTKRVIKKNKFIMDFITLTGAKIIVTVKISLSKNGEDSTLLLIVYPLEKNEIETKNKSEDLLFDELELLEAKAENLVDFTDKLKKTKEELKEINSKKDKFFNIIAHDLRAPFNSILGLTEILKLESEELSPQEVTDLASRIHNNSKNVLEMVEDLLNWARMQTNHIPYNPEIISVSDLIFDTLYLLKQEAASKDIELKTEFDENISVYGDQNMLNLILRNLVSNAIKFTGQKGVMKISVSSMGSKVKISVQDNGVGIKNENLKKILAIDEHYTKLGTDNEKGTGLGLILCQEFLSKNRSKLLINSIFGEGSTFSFELPVGIK